MLDEFDNILKQVSDEIEDLQLTNIKFVERLAAALELYQGSDDDAEDFSFRG